MHLYTIQELPQGWSVYPYIYKGYRVNNSFRQCIVSVFNANNNEFWMIWTDIFPIFLYTHLYVSWHYSPAYQHMSVFYKTLAIGSYIAAYTTRICSCIYHIFNPISLQVNQRLINLDYIGIVFMLCGYPWVFVNSLQITTYTDARFLTYTLFVSLAFIISIAYFTRMLVKNNSPTISQETILLALSGIGTGTSSVIIFDANANILWRLHCGIGLFCFIFGYLVFFTWHFPENKYSSISPILYSHIFWHNIVSLGQYLYLCTTFL